MSAHLSRVIKPRDSMKLFMFPVHATFVEFDLFCSKEACILYEMMGFVYAEQRFWEPSRKCSVSPFIQIQREGARGGSSWSKQLSLRVQINRKHTNPCYEDRLPSYLLFFYKQHPQRVVIPW